jgi:hypothetical protein
MTNPPTKLHRTRSRPSTMVRVQRVTFSESGKPLEVAPPPDLDGVLALVVRAST